MRWSFIIGLLLGWSNPALSNGTEATTPQCACACVDLAGVENDDRNVTIETFDVSDRTRTSCREFNGRRCALEDPVLGFVGTGRAEQCGEIKRLIMTPVSR